MSERMEEKAGECVGKSAGQTIQRTSGRLRKPSQRRRDAGQKSKGINDNDIKNVKVPASVTSPAIVDLSSLCEDGQSAVPMSECLGNSQITSVTSPNLMELVAVSESASTLSAPTLLHSLTTIAANELDTLLSIPPSSTNATSSSAKSRAIRLNEEEGQELVIMTADHEEEEEEEEEEELIVIGRDHMESNHSSQALSRSNTSSPIHLQVHSEDLKRCLFTLQLVDVPANPCSLVEALEKLRKPFEELKISKQVCGIFT
jgi:hypothetical protein